MFARTRPAWCSLSVEQTRVAKPRSKKFRGCTKGRNLLGNSKFARSVAPNVAHVVYRQMSLRPSPGALTVSIAPILVADPDADDVAIIELLLKKAGIEHPVEICRCSDDLIGCLSKLLKQTVGCVLPLLCFLEIGLPSTDGHEVLRWIREQPQFDGMSVVMVSTSEHPTDVKKAAHAGAQCYLAKYPHPSVLRAVIDEAKRLDGQTVADEWFGLRANLLLRWGLPHTLSAPRVTSSASSVAPTA
jgi:CheY-like chemotaxis protein